MEIRHAARYRCESSRYRAALCFARNLRPFPGALTRIGVVRYVVSDLPKGDTRMDEYERVALTAADAIIAEFGSVLSSTSKLRLALSLAYLNGYRTGLQDGKVIADDAFSVLRARLAT